MVRADHDFAAGGKQPQHGKEGDAFTGTAFAYHTDAFPASYMQADSAHRLHLAAAGQKGCFQVMDFQQVGHAGGNRLASVAI